MCFLWLSANLYPNSVPTCVWGSSSQLEHPNLHQWNASPKFSIQILLVPMGSESMQCLVEVETQSFEIKHLLPWSHHVVSHHVTLKWIRVLCVPLTSKSFQFRVASLSSCKLTPKMGTSPFLPNDFAIFSQTFEHRERFTKEPKEPKGFEPMYDARLHGKFKGFFHSWPSKEISIRGYMYLWRDI